jgi:hypothetical protein
MVCFLGAKSLSYIFNGIKKNYLPTPLRWISIVEGNFLLLKIYKNKSLCSQALHTCQCSRVSVILTLYRSTETAVRFSRISEFLRQISCFYQCFMVCFLGAKSLSYIFNGIYNMTYDLTTKENKY